MQNTNYRAESQESTAGSRYLRELIQTKQHQQRLADPKLFSDEEMEKLQSQYLAIEKNSNGRQRLDSDTPQARNKNILNTLTCGDFEGSSSKNPKYMKEEDNSIFYAGAMTRLNKKMINDNVQLAQRLVNQPGTLPKKKWEQSYKDHCKYSALRSKFKQISPHTRLVINSQNCQFSETFYGNSDNKLKNPSPSSPVKSFNIRLQPDVHRSPLNKKHNEIQDLAPLFSSPNNFYGTPLKEFNSPLIAESVKNILSPEEDYNLSQQFRRQARSFSSGNNIYNRRDLNSSFLNKNNGQLSFNSQLGMKVDALNLNSTPKDFHSSQFQFSFSQNGGQKQHSQVFLFDQLRYLKFSVYLDGLNSVECCLVQINDKGTNILGKMFLDVAADKKEEIKEIEVPIYSMYEGITNPIGSAQLVLRIQVLFSQPLTRGDNNNNASFLPSLRQKFNSPTVFAEKEKLGSASNFSFNSPFADSFEKLVFSEGQKQSPGKDHKITRNQRKYSDEQGSPDQYQNKQLDATDNQINNTNKGVLDMRDFFETIAISQSHKGNLAKVKALKNRIGQLKNDGDTIPCRNKTFQDNTTPNPLKNTRLKMSDFQQEQQYEAIQKQYEQAYKLGNDQLSFGGY